MSRRKKELTEEELPDPETWDFENAVTLPPVKNPRAIVSVAFPGDDFDMVSDAADRLGMRLSEFIRRAAIDHARGAPAPDVSGAPGAEIYAGRLPSKTNAHWSAIADKDEDVVSGW